MLGPSQLANPGADDRAVPDTYRRATKECFVGSDLNAPCRVSVAVNGAGITRCSTALVLAERGIDVLVLEGAGPRAVLLDKWSLTASTMSTGPGVSSASSGAMR